MTGIGPAINLGLQDEQCCNKRARGFCKVVLSAIFFAKCICSIFHSFLHGFYSKNVDVLLIIVGSAVERKLILKQKSTANYINKLEQCQKFCVMIIF